MNYKSFFKRDSFFINIQVYTYANVISNAIPFILLPFLTIYLKPSDYGNLNVAISLISIMNIFVGLNTVGAIQKKYIELNKKDLQIYISTIYIILFLSFFIVSFVILIFTDYISKITNLSSNIFPLLIITSFSQFSINLLLTILNISKRSKYYFVISVTRVFLINTLLISLIIFFDVNWLSKIYSYLIIDSIFSLYAFYFLLKEKFLIFKFSKNYLFSALRFGIPLIPHSLGALSISLSDRLMVNYFYGPSDGGMYSLGFQIGAIIGILALSFNQAFVPYLYEKLKKNNFKDKLKIVKFTYLYFFAIITLAFLLNFIFSNFLYKLFDNAFKQSGVYVIFIALGFSFQGMYYMVVNYLFYTLKTNIVAYSTIITVIINIFLNYFLIVNFGPIGAAISTTLSFFINFIIVWIFSSKIYPMPWNLCKYKKNIIMEV
jgi:O-antigen/teichoic acid export membrane protein